MDKDNFNSKMKEIAKLINDSKFPTSFNPDMAITLTGYLSLDDGVNPILNMKVDYDLSEKNMVQVSVLFPYASDNRVIRVNLDKHAIRFNPTRPSHVIARDIIKRGYKIFTQENLKAYALLVKHEDYLQQKQRLRGELLRLGLRESGTSDLLLLPASVSSRITAVRVGSDRLHIKLSAEGLSLDEFKSLLKILEKPNERMEIETSEA